MTLIKNRWKKSSFPFLSQHSSLEFYSLRARFPSSSWIILLLIEMTYLRVLEPWLDNKSRHIHSTCARRNEFSFCSWHVIFLNFLKWWCLYWIACEVLQNRTLELEKMNTHLESIFDRKADENIINHFHRVSVRLIIILFPVPIFANSARVLRTVLSFPYNWMLNQPRVSKETLIHSIFVILILREKRKYRVLELFWEKASMIGMKYHPEVWWRIQN